MDNIFEKTVRCPICISDKPLLHHYTPSTLKEGNEPNQEVVIEALPNISTPNGRMVLRNYVNNLVFNYNIVDISGFEKYYRKGYSFSYFFKPKAENTPFFDRSGMTRENYYGTQVVIVCIKNTTLSIHEFKNYFEHEPSFGHSTFYSRSDYKKGLSEFKFYFVFDKMIDGEENFWKVFNKLTEKVPADFVDLKASDICQVFTTADSEYLRKHGKKFEYFYSGMFYSINKFLGTEDNKPKEEVLATEEKPVTEAAVEVKKEPKEEVPAVEDVPVNESSFDDFLREEEPAVIEKPVDEEFEARSLPSIGVQTFENKFGLDEKFLEDFMKKSLEGFLIENKYKFKIVTSTPITDSMYDESGEFADLRGVKLYRLPSARVIYKGDSRQHIRIYKEYRDSTLLQDGKCLKKILLGMESEGDYKISKEHFIYILTNQVFKFYKDLDKDETVTKNLIIDKAKEAWEWEGEVKSEKRTVKPNYQKLIENGCEVTSTKGLRRIAIGKLNTKTILDNYDTNLSFEENLDNMMSIGIKLSEKTIKNKLKENNIKYFSLKKKKNKERDALILKLKEDNPSAKQKEIRQMIADSGFKPVPSEDTIWLVLKKNGKIRKKEKK